MSLVKYLWFQDSIVLIEQHKSGFERPGDLEFEDYSQGINRASSDSSLGTPKGPLDLLGKNKSKPFWLFSKKSKVSSLSLICADIAQWSWSTGDHLSTVIHFSNI